jgi:hypothetical protein
MIPLEVWKAFSISVPRRIRRRHKYQERKKVIVGDTPEKEVAEVRQTQEYKDRYQENKRSACQGAAREGG